MLDFIRQLLTGSSSQDKKKTGGQDQNRQKRLQVATCALFVEMANADSEFTKEERDKIISIMQKTFNINQEYVEELIELAEYQLQESVSIYEFTSMINRNYTQDEKFEILKNLWRLVYTDEILDKYEDTLVKRIGNNFVFDHKEIMDAKVAVIEEMKKDKDK